MLIFVFREQIHIVRAIGASGKATLITSHCGVASDVERTQVQQYPAKRVGEMPERCIECAARWDRMHA
jgi:hypothetical protein